MKAFVVTVPAGEIDLASDMLWGLGVRAVEERTAAGGEGRVELWTILGDRADAIGHAADRVRSNWTWITVEVDPVPAETWREHTQPISVGNFVMIIPAWLDMEPPRGVTGVRIEPGASFGLGDHPTTRLSVEHLVRELAGRPQPRVLDVGCGSGVLAITALLRGAVEARAIDVSAAAIDAARHNAVANSVAQRFDADVTPIAEVSGQFDIVLANILAPTLVSIADDLQRVCAPDGSLVISGVLADRHDHVIEALRPMEVVRSSDLDGWSAVTLRWPR